MIGIFGLYHADPAAPADPGPMAATLSNRYTVDAAAATGAALGRVSHRDGAWSGRAASPDGRRVAVAAGAVFNLPEFADRDDGPRNAAELVLQLYETNALDRLNAANGQFCVALYDAAAHRLVLVTDRLATFPLHLWRRDGDVTFATQLYTLIGDPRVPRRADPDAVAQLFTMQRTFGRGTPIAGVEALPAACICEIDSRGLRERRYWTLAWRRADFGEREGAERLAGALRNAVRRQRNGRRFGLLLSGGMDSRLVLAACNGAAPSCWTTASYASNPELAVARRTADLFGAEHHALVVEPPATLHVLDQTVVESSGLYPASTAMSAFLPQVGASCAAAFTGHGLDYTLRGYYLPARFLEVGGSRTRLPILRPIPRQPTGGYVLENLRQGPPRRTVERIVPAHRRDAWWDGQAETMQGVLEPWLTSEEPYNAWDAFILHAVSKHYAFTSMMAVRAVCDLAIPAFDNEVFETYLAMPPAWRCRGRMVQRALAALSREAARLPNANTHFRADLEPWLEVGGLLARGAFRRLGLAAPPQGPSPMHSAGSWQDIAALYREDAGHRDRLSAIRDRLNDIALGLLDCDGLAACIDEHLDGRANHGKLLRQLLTHDSWVCGFGIVGAA